jgi:hypothetical protein
MCGAGMTGFGGPDGEPCTHDVLERHGVGLDAHDSERATNAPLWRQ